VLRVRVAAKPVDGLANEALCRLVADALDVAPSRVAIAGGRSARVKMIEVDGVGRDAVRSRWPGIEV
jgi:uncharacterized protein YggU (UPF0235/DUF167 family)